MANQCWRMSEKDIYHCLHGNAVDVPKKKPQVNSVVQLIFVWCNHLAILDFRMTFCQFHEKPHADSQTAMSNWICFECSIHSIKPTRQTQVFDLTFQSIKPIPFCLVYWRLCVFKQVSLLLNFWIKMINNTQKEDQDMGDKWKRKWFQE